MSDKMTPDSRVFHISRECYVVYLGRERDDIRPFLRIGNMRNLSQEIINVISTTVITEEHTGNPLLEILYTPNIRGRYVGDTDVVGSIRRFFESFDLPTDEVTDYHEIKDREKRHLIWFYSSGNINLHFENQVLFDLASRAKADRHFLNLYEEAKGEFLRNTLRYIRQDFRGPGMILQKGNAFWFEGGELLAVHPSPGFVPQLMMAGIDPDFITAYATDIDSGTLDTSDSAVFVGYIKRAQQRRKQINVITPEPLLLRKLKLLFPPRDSTPATIEVGDVSEGQKAFFRDSVVLRKESGWQIQHKGSLPVYVNTPGKGNHLHIDTEENIITAYSSSSSQEIEFPEGFPLSFVLSLPDLSQILEKYLIYLIPLLRGHLSESEVVAVTAVERYARSLLEILQASSSEVNSTHRQLAATARDALRDAVPTPQTLPWFFYKNLVSYLQLAVQQAGGKHPLVTPAQGVLKEAQAIIEEMGDPEGLLPYWGDLYLTDSPYLFWRSVKRLVTKTELTSSQGVSQKIAVIASLNEKPWIRDRERLLRLIRSLARGGTGPLTKEQLTLVGEAPPEKIKPPPQKIAPKRSAAPEKKVQKPSSPKPPPSPPISRAPLSSPNLGVSSGKTSSRRRKGPLLIAAAALLALLLGGGAYLWYQSSSPSPGEGIQAEFPLAAAGPSGEESSSSEEGPGDSNSDHAAGEGITLTDNDSPVSPETSGGETPSLDSPEQDRTPGDTASGTSGDLGIVKEIPTGSDGHGRPLGAVAVPEGGIDPDVAPQTKQEAQDYLIVGQQVVITEIDIHLAANEIAVKNEYKDLDYRVFTGKDPDWIWPGNMLFMPDDTDYVVRRGDTIWFLAARLIRLDVQKDLVRMERAETSLSSSDLGDAEKKSNLAVLESIMEKSRAAGLRELASRLFFVYNK